MYNVLRRAAKSRLMHIEISSFAKKPLWRQGMKDQDEEAPRVVRLLSIQNIALEFITL